MKTLQSGINKSDLLMKAGIFSCIGIFALAATATNALALSLDRETPEPSDKAARSLAKYELTGETRICLPLRQVKSIKALDDHHFLVRLAGRKYYLNVTNKKCFGASRSNTRIQYTLPQNQLCRNEIIRILDNTTGFQNGSCGLNEFQELRVKPVEEESTQ